MDKLTPITRARLLRARGGALRRQLLELNDKCIDNYVIALDLMRQIIEKRQALAKRYPWLAADV